MALKVPYLVVTNGVENYVCYIDHEKKKYFFLREIPMYKELMTVPDFSSAGKEG
jgi:hypothetical protein